MSDQQPGILTFPNALLARHAKWILYPLKGMANDRLTINLSCRFMLHVLPARLMADSDHMQTNESIF